jgi:hypothetical protein
MRFIVAFLVRSARIGVVTRNAGAFRLDVACRLPRKRSGDPGFFQRYDTTAFRGSACLVQV